MLFANMLLIKPLLTGLLDTLIYSLLGIALCFFAFKVVDWMLPGDLPTQIADDRNVAIAIVAAAMILGVSIIIAAAIAG